jgi:hypothetical protein
MEGLTNNTLERFFYWEAVVACGTIPEFFFWDSEKSQ